MDMVERYRRAKSPVRPFVRRHWQHPVLAGVARTARRVIALYENETHDLNVNGEAEVMRRLVPLGMRRVIDAGCFEGSWTSLVRGLYPECTVHCFEPSPAVADALDVRFADDDRVIVNHCALSDAAGEATLHIDLLQPSMTSLVPSDATTRATTVRTLTGDEYLEEVGWDRLDFLKVDAEGHDFHILRGFRGALTDGRIQALQFEYNRWNVRSRVLLADFYELLEPLGYRIGKVHPDGVDFRRYDIALENWIGPACVAVHRDHPAIVAALSVPRRER